MKDEILKVAIQSAREAGEILRKHFKKDFEVNEKKGAGLVTSVDIAAEKIVIHGLRKWNPDFEIIAEESTHLLQDNIKKNPNPPGRWFIDPLDGTTNFVHGFPMFCVSIGAEWNGELVAGVIYHPIFDDLYAASLGNGATLNGEPIRVSKTEKISDALLSTGFAYQKGSRLHEEMTRFEKVSSNARAVRRPGSAALDLAYTACGIFDGFWERGLNSWDLAAGALLVQEAGGKATNYAEENFKVSHNEILTANPKLHASLLKVIQSKT